jgi:hypothetical protein
MSEDDFGTINVRRGERAREIEVLRQHYRTHRDSLQRMTADAPTEHLASEYQRLVNEIDRALGKLDELEGKPAMPVTAPPAHEPTRPHGDPLAAQRPEAGSRPLVIPPPAVPPTPPPHPARAGMDIADAPTLPGNEQYDVEPRSRVPIIIGAALLALALIGWLIWRASSERGGETIVEERPVVETADTTDTTEAGTPEPVTNTVAAAATGLLRVTPAAQDYGTIRKGTRATRQFELTNTSEEPISIAVARSACRCLFYEHAPVIPPKAKENITVTVDAARAKAGALREQIRVTSKADPAVGATLDVNATIQ